MESREIYVGVESVSGGKGRGGRGAKDLPEPVPARMYQGSAECAKCLEGREIGATAAAASEDVDQRSRGEQTAGGKSKVSSAVTPSAGRMRDSPDGETDRDFDQGRSRAETARIERVADGAVVVAGRLSEAQQTTVRETRRQLDEYTVGAAARTSAGGASDVHLKEETHPGTMTTKGEPRVNLP